MNVSVLNIVLEMSKYPTISNYAYLPELLDPITEKLGENRISVRKATVKLFKEFLKELNTDILFAHLLESLGNKNWHIREEVLQIFVTALLMVNSSVNYDFIKLVLPVAKLLDDEKAKIRFVA